MVSALTQLQGTEELYQMKRNMTVTIAILSILLSVSAAAGCDKKTGAAEYKPTGIEVSQTTLDLKVGESMQLNATVLPAVAVQPNLEWNSADGKVATVSNGLVKAQDVGETTIKVGYKGVEKTIAVKVTALVVEEKHALLYDKLLNSNHSVSDIITNGVAAFKPEGLSITGTNNVAKLDRFYGIAERKVQYTVRFSADAKAIFRSSEGDFNAYIDVANKRIKIATNPAKEASVPFLQANRDFIVEVYHVYQQAKLRIVDMQTGEAAEVVAVNDGQGGVGKGILQPGFSVGMQWDHYCFGLSSGSSMVVKRITVYALKKNVKMLLYGDSITQPEGYFPTKDFSLAWTQQVINKLNGNAMSSGRGGATIDMLLEYIKNELPFIEAKYVMVTIGTNGGNTEAKLKQLVDYIKSQGATPILNNIPSNESGTQINENLLIEKVRADAGIKGCRFDIATSISGDGKEVDKTTMYWEDYTGSYGWQIYHHPNEIGGTKMFERTLADVPEIYE